MTVTNETKTPVLLTEAREIAAVHGNWVDPDGSPAKARAGGWDENHRVQIALAALKRGMELASNAQIAELREALLEVIEIADSHGAMNYVGSARRLEAARSLAFAKSASEAEGV